MKNLNFNMYREVEHFENRSFQYMPAVEKRVFSNKNVQAFINNVSVPKTLDELEWFVDEHGCFSVEDILEESYTTWTAPRWAKPGDIVFFMHAKYAHQPLRTLQKELERHWEDFSQERANELNDWIQRGFAIHKKYGGRILAVGRVCGMPEVIPEENQDLFHWGSNIYVDIDQVVQLENLIEFEEFSPMIQISRQSGITSVFGKEFDALKEIVLSKNDMPAYFVESVSSPLPLTKVHQDNWMTLTNEYRRAFLLETQFRTYYVDFLLQGLSDIKTLYKECRCVKAGMADSFVDNMIKFCGKYLPVEVKLSIYCQSDIRQQVTKYCYDDRIVIDQKKDRAVCGEQVVQNKVLIIDTEAVYLYDDDAYEVKEIFSLDDLRQKEDVLVLREMLVEKVFGGV